jgi:hypothetical protein
VQKNYFEMLLGMTFKSFEKLDRDVGFYGAREIFGVEFFFSRVLNFAIFIVLK